MHFADRSGQYGSSRHSYQPMSFRKPDYDPYPEAFLLFASSLKEHPMDKEVFTVRVIMWAAQNICTSDRLRLSDYRLCVGAVNQYFSTFRVAWTSLSAVPRHSNFMDSQCTSFVTTTTRLVLSGNYCQQVATWQGTV